MPRAAARPPRAAAFDTMAGADSTRQLGAALPAAVRPVADAVQAAATELPKLLPSAVAENPDALNELQNVRAPADAAAAAACRRRPAANA